MNKNELKDKAKQFGADLIGVASAEAFDGVAPENHPLSIFPECKSVIVVGRRILRGSLRGIEEGTNFGSTYGFFGFRMLEDNFLSKTTYDLTCWIEEQCSEAVPLFGYNPDGMPKGVKVSDDKPEPNVILDFDVACQAAGLAEIGLGGFLITPEFGTRQRFAAILTDMELEPDQVRDRSICGDCEMCFAACPLGAYNPEKRIKKGVKGHECEVAEIDYSICEKCQNGAVKMPGRGTGVDRIAAACGRACVAQLEQAEKCSNKFKNKFRKRKPWALDLLSQPVESGSIDIGCDKVSNLK